MQYDVSPIWQRLPADVVSNIERCVAAGCERSAAGGETHIFFRADDIAAPGQQFVRLLQIFSRYRAPLCLAIVPAWLTRPRWSALRRIARTNGSRWCWHQHGWRHTNHEVEGKKQEFGPARSRADIEHDISCGRHRLEKLLDKEFYPVFTPPWNRCDQKALDVLELLGYAAVSRSRGSRPKSSERLPSYDVNVDLHTRKEKSPAAGWSNLFDELQQAIASGCCGIMIHHQRMNQAAFDFLEMLLTVLNRHEELKLVDFEGLARSIK